MNLYFVKQDRLDDKHRLNEYVAGLAAPIDSFLEAKILSSEYFLIMLGEKEVGFLAIRNQEQLTMFFIIKEYRRYSQEIFFHVKRMQQVQLALVPTCDQFFLSHALDEYQRQEKQAYFFQDSGIALERDLNLQVRLARPEDYQEIISKSNGFFDKLEARIEKNEIYIATKDQITVGFGIIENGILLSQYASIGMYTVAEHRRQGIGRNILLWLKERVYAEQRRPIAGCWYYNHFSKKTLESAGMYTDTRLIKVYF